MTAIFLAFLFGVGVPIDRNQSFPSFAYFGCPVSGFLPRRSLFFEVGVGEAQGGWDG